MYKLTLGTINYIKASTGYSGTIETDRVVIVNGSGNYLQVDGNWGSNLVNGLVRTYSATLDKVTTDLLKAKYTSVSATTAAVYVWDGKMVLQSDYDSVDAFIESLVDGGEIVIQSGYTSPTYKLSTVTVKSAGSGYTDGTADVTVAGETGDTAGVVTVTISSNKVASAVIKTAGSYEHKVASQDVTVPDGTGGAITVTMAIDE